MTTIRIQKTKNYSIISNHHLQNTSLSLKAKGLLTYLLSLPDDWNANVKHLIKTCTDGKAAIYSAIKELKAAGYVEHLVIRGKGAKIIKWEYVVHEGPMEKPVNRGSEPLTDFQHVGFQQIENRDSIIKTKNPLPKTNLKNDVQTQPPNPDSMQEPRKNSLPPLSQNQIITILAGLLALIPKQHHKPSIEKTIERGLKAHSEDYIQAAIAYTIANSNGGTWQKFKAYLGKCIDNGWADGWEPDQGSQVDKDAIRKRFQKMPGKDLKVFAETGNVWAIEELKQRNHNAKF